ncbi:MAG: hypothetical protein MZV70_18815 [Desulfobacterales bacterium]|nr:hypothetical protein [Desulfobacterales bacterium]
MVVGDPEQIVIPATDDYRAAPGRLNGLRCIHTHLDDEPLTRDDLTDLALLRLDLMAAIGQSAGRLPAQPSTWPTCCRGPPSGCRIACCRRSRRSALDIDCAAHDPGPGGRAASGWSRGRAAGAARERALLVSVSSASRRQTEESMAELQRAGALRRHRGRRLA